MQTSATFTKEKLIERCNSVIRNHFEHRDAILTLRALDLAQRHNKPVADVAKKAIANAEVKDCGGLDIALRILDILARNPSIETLQVPLEELNLMGPETGLDYTMDETRKKLQSWPAPAAAAARRAVTAALQEERKLV